MILNLEAYGIGVGLVMAGWFAGMAVSYVFSLVRNLRYLG